jgi:hypothetical protein
VAGFYCVFYRAPLANDSDLDLSRVVEALLDALADLFAMRAAPRSSTSSGLTMMRTSRPAWIAKDFSTPGKALATASRASRRFR